MEIHAGAMENSMEDPQKIEVPYDPAIPTLVFSQRKQNTDSN